ncbi:MAG: hypothetical protein ACLU8F_07080 [Clostridia bacterium]
MELALNKKIENNLENNNLNIEKKQNDFLETTLGKTINSALDIGLRLVLPDMIENQVIDIKNTILQEGLKEGINKAINSAVDIGKSAIGIVTGKFDNISQVQNAVEKGGIIDSISKTIDIVLKKTTEKGLINNRVANVIKQGKNVILDNVSKNIENTLTNQIKSIEKLEDYSKNWNEYYQNRDFEGMEKEYNKIQKSLKEIMPLETTIKRARKIENLHNLIKNNGQNFELSDTQLELAERLN